jgi:hypothetical protein
MNSDVAPEWLISSATTHSKMEHQRDERVNTMTKRQHQGAANSGNDSGKGGKGDKGGKGGKGKDGKGKGGGKAPTQG